MPKQWPQVVSGEILTERNETPDPALVQAGDIHYQQNPFLGRGNRIPYRS